MVGPLVLASSRLVGAPREGYVRGGGGAVSVDPAESPGGTPRQGILLAAAMFVFVIDTSFMNVSISAVVHDLDTTVSGVQSAVAMARRPA
jgi:hypothetical protein